MLKPARTIVALVITAMSAVALAAPAQADPVATAWVQFGSQPNPFTPGTSCTNPSNYVSTLSAFQTVVNNMASGGIINICGDSLSALSVTSSVVIDKPLTIRGSQTSDRPQFVSSSTTSSIFRIATANFGDEVRISNLTLRYTGTGITFVASNPGGGAIVVTKGKLVVDKVRFHNFTVTGKGGALSIATTDALDRASITNSAFTNNTATFGGAVYVKDVAPTEINNSGVTAGGQADFINVTFSQNTATNKGAAVYAPSTTVDFDSFINLNHTTIVDNPAAANVGVLSGSGVQTSNSIVAQRLETGALCNDGAQILFGNLITDGDSCGVHERFTFGSKNLSRVVKFSELALGRLITRGDVIPYFAIMQNLTQDTQDVNYLSSAAVDYLETAAGADQYPGDSIDFDIRGTQRRSVLSGSLKDVGAFEYATPQLGGLAFPSVETTGFIKSQNDQAGENFIDAYRFGRSNYRISTQNYIVDATGSNQSTMTVQYTSLTPQLCTISDPTTLASFAVPQGDSSISGYCIIEAYAPSIINTNASEFLHFIELRIYYGTAPTQPRDVNLAAGETDISVSFQPPSDTGAGIDGYTLMVNGANSFERTTTCTAGETTWVCSISSLTRATNYTATLIVNSTGGRQTFFTIGATKTLQQRRPSAVTSVTAKATPKAGITVTWKKPAISGRSSLATYMVRLYLSTNKTKAILVKSLNLKTLKYVFTKLKPKKKYIIKIFAYNKDGYFSKVERTVTVK